MSTDQPVSYFFLFLQNSSSIHSFHLLEVVHMILFTIDSSLVTGYEMNGTLVIVSDM